MVQDVWVEGDKSLEMKTHALPTSTSPCHRLEQSCEDSHQSLVVPGQHTVLPGGHQKPAPQKGNT